MPSFTIVMEVSELKFLKLEAHKNNKKELRKTLKKIKLFGKKIIFIKTTIKFGEHVQKNSMHIFVFKIIYL